MLIHMCAAICMCVCVCASVVMCVRAREFQWTPKEDEDGDTYRVCFVAKDSSGI